MSSHFSANQYESAFSPQRLQNYQIPAQHKKHPATRTGKTVIVSNDRGHLSKRHKTFVSSPWGTYVGTWQMNRKPVQLKTKSNLCVKLQPKSTSENESAKAGTGLGQENDIPVPQVKSTGMIEAPNMIASNNSENGTDPVNTHAFYPNSMQESMCESECPGTPVVQSTVCSDRGSSTQASRGISANGAPHSIDVA